MPRRSALLILFLLALALFARPLVRYEVLMFRDHGDYFQPLRHFTSGELRHFRLPLWNPYNASGEPWLANPQTGVFYPPAWLFLIFPFATAYVLYLLLHVALLGCGAFLLFSRFGSSGAAFVGAAALMLCGPTLSLLDVTNNLTTFAWIPWVLWCALNASPMVSASAIALSFLGGEPFFAAVGAVMFAILRRRQIVDIAITSFCLAAIQLLPFLAAVAGSDRSGIVSSEEILRESMPIGDWISVALPMGRTHQQFIPYVYVGVIPVFLALLAIVTSVRSRVVQGWIALLAVCVVVSAGSHLPLIGSLLTRLPLTIIRYPARVVPLAALAIIALGVIGFQAVSSRISFRWFPAMITALIIADLIPRVAPLLESAPFNPHPVPYAGAIGRDGKIARLIDIRGFDRRAWIAGYLNLFDRRFDAWTAAPFVSRGYTEAYEAAATHPERLEAMSVAYILANRRIAALEPIARAGEVIVHRDPAAAPLAYWRDDAGHASRVSLLAFTTTAVHITVDAPAPGTVVLTQTSASGWTVEVDGTRAAPRAVGIFRGVQVHAGHHEITWRYHSLPLAIGAALTLTAIARMLLSQKFVKATRRKIFFARASLLRLQV